MYLDLPLIGIPATKMMSVEVTQKQQGLIKHHAGIPNRGRPPQQRQQDFAEHRLQYEHQGGAEEQYPGE